MTSITRAIPQIRPDRLDDLVSRDRHRQAPATYLGAPIEPLKRGLPKTVESICPECRRVIPALLRDIDGAVWMEKTCPEHGDWRELYWSDTALYLRAEQFTFGDGRGLTNPQNPSAGRCPENCGLCAMHISHTALGNIDLTNRCNMTCPVCFANANSSGTICEPSFDDVLKMLRALRGTRPVAGRVVQFSGGEPTLHPDFHRIIAAARDMGFAHIQMATNGIKLADPDFAHRTAEAGMHTVYLQFDGVDDESHRRTRGRAGYFDVKMRAIENCRTTGLRITLVPTILRGCNDHQVGAILKFALEHADVIGGISFQPVALTGRIDESRRREMRYTIPDLVKDLKSQTGLLQEDDFYPIACTSPFSKLAMALRGVDSINITCHPHCSLATYMVVNPKIPYESAVPVTRYVDVEGMLARMNELAFKMDRAAVKLFTRIEAFTSLKRYFNEQQAPPGMTYTKFLEALNGIVDKKVGRAGGGTEWKFLLIGAMHFMDAYNYEIERVRRCVIHYAAPDGGLYPFCAYNSGAQFRDRIEHEYGQTFDPQQ